MQNLCTFISSSSNDRTRENGSRSGSRGRDTASDFDNICQSRGNSLVHNPSPTLERRWFLVQRDDPGLDDQLGGSTESVPKLVRLFPEDRKCLTSHTTSHHASNSFCCAQTCLMRKFCRVGFDIQMVGCTNLLNIIHIGIKFLEHDFHFIFCLKLHWFSQFSCLFIVPSCYKI